MRDRYDLFGSLPDTIEDDRIEDIEKLDTYLSQFTERKKQANAFDPRQGKMVESKDTAWEWCERVLARRDVIERLSRGGDAGGRKSRGRRDRRDLEAPRGR